MAIGVLGLEGDSGGPIYSMFANRVQIVGVLSMLNAQISKLSFFGNRCHWVKIT